MSVGRVVAVYTERLGCLVTQTVVGDNTVTVIPVDYHVVDFAESGGQLQHLETGDIYSYASSDDEAETIVLSAGLPVGKTFTADDTLYVYPRASDYYADVAVDDVNDEEPTSARVPQELRAQLPEGIEPGQLLRLEADGEGWDVTGLVGQEPAIDAGYIDTSVNPIPTSDGLPPSVSPTPTIVGVPRLLIVSWPAIANVDPVTYEVHVSTTSGFTPDSSTLVHETAATMTPIEVLPPTDSVLAYETDYFVRIVAKDEDGSAAAGTQAAGQLDPNGTPDIAVGAVTAATLEAFLVLASTIATASTGRRVEISNEGIVVYEQNNDILVNLTTDPDSPMTFAGEGVFDALTVLGGLSIRGTTGSVEPGSILTLQATVQASQTQPSAIITWPYEVLDSDQFPDRKRGLFWNAADSTWFFCVALFGGTVNQVSTTGAAVSGWTLLGPGGANNVNPEGGITKIGSTWYVLAYETGTTDWYVYKYNSSFVFQSRWAYIDNANGKRPAIGTDGTDIIIVRTPTAGPDTGKVHIRHYDPANGTPDAGNPIVTDVDYQADLVGIHYIPSGGQFGAVNRYVIAQRAAGSGDEIRVHSTTGVEQANETWLIADSATLAGLGWDGTNFHHLSEGSVNSLARISKYLTANRWTTESSKWWVSYTWYDSDATGGTHETTQSVRRSLTMKKRARLKVTIPTIPDLGGTDDPDSGRIYLGRGSTDPGQASMWLNASPAAGVITADIDAAVFSAVANPPAINNFPGAEPAKIAGSDGSILLDGNSRGWISYTPTLTNWTVGNGTLTGQYTRLGNLIHFQIKLTIGSTSGTAGTLRLSLPVTAALTANAAIGQAGCKDTAASNPRPRTVCLSTTSTVEMFDDSGTAVNANQPFTWGSGDTMELTGTYEAA